MHRALPTLILLALLSTSTAAQPLTHTALLLIQNAQKLRAYTVARATALEKQGIHIPQAWQLVETADTYLCRTTPLLRENPREALITIIQAIILYGKALKLLSYAEPQPRQPPSTDTTSLLHHRASLFLEILQKSATGTQGETLREKLSAIIHGKTDPAEAQTILQEASRALRHKAILEAAHQVGIQAATPGSAATDIDDTLFNMLISKVLHKTQPLAQPKNKK